MQLYVTFDRIGAPMVTIITVQVQMFRKIEIDYDTLSYKSGL
jgi:hypothetical protein